MLAGQYPRGHGAQRDPCACADECRCVQREPAASEWMRLLWPEQTGQTHPRKPKRLEIQGGGPPVDDQSLTAPTRAAPHAEITCTLRVIVCVRRKRSEAVQLDGVVAQYGSSGLYLWRPIHQTVEDHAIVGLAVAGQRRVRPVAAPQHSVRAVADKRTGHAPDICVKGAPAFDRR